MKSRLRSGAGITICIGVAAALCVLLKESSGTRFVAPAVCLQAVILVSLVFGRLSSLVGSLATSLILTFFLFPPVGSLMIHDPLEITMLVLFQAASIVVVLISPDHHFRSPYRFPW